ncbi:bifunctional alpha/beta hydrolase/OsmC family protein [Salinimicrobium catena]|uniref:bifunctional alpha/beta hydrolase/OsmC family protein n=1 Tax=Salinimicrobium catena TaxID=390640 RepID=UPI002FE4F15C
MNYKKVFFRNKKGNELSGYLELPLNKEPHSFVLFAHCFTCNKNFFAVKNVARALSAKGYGVLRFDFTGLGESEGDFSDTTFYGNVEDLLSAADFLEKEHAAPSLLVGHSLGGAAVILAAKQLPSVKAVATIGAPSTPQHVTHIMRSEIEEIKEKGIAEVNVGGRNFKIKEKFLNDLNGREVQKMVAELDAALLILHSPQDPVVEIKNAEELYVAARHPKSFVTLDGADHLLTNTKDSTYAGEVIAAWASRYLSIPEQKILSTDHQVVANLGEEGFTTQLRAGKHYFTSDEPKSVGGSDFGPTPYDFLSAALAACTSMTVQMYVRRKKWPLVNIETHVNHNKTHVDDCNNCERNTSKIDVFEREIILEGNLDEEQQQKVLEIANKCPVHRTLHNKIEINTRLGKK